MTKRQNNTKKIVKVRKRDNSQDGRKAHNDSVLIKVGRIKQNSWANEKLKAADVFIDETELVHIFNRHNREISSFHHTPLSFVIHVITNFNEIYESPEPDCFVLVVKQQLFSNQAVIQLSFDGTQYKVKTAAPIKTKQLLNRKLLCAKDQIEKK